MGTDLMGEVRARFFLAEEDIRTYSPLSLAYIGDSVYELVVRSVVLGTKERTVHHLHKRTCELVKAQTQREIAGHIASLLTEEEQAVFRRGRNAKSYSVAKNASVTDYRVATGLEALCGYLYLLGRTDRVLELIKAGLDAMEEH